MTEKYPIQSEGEQLESFLSELEREHTVKDISGWETGFANLSRALDGILPGLYFLIGPPGVRQDLARQATPRSSGPAQQCAGSLFQLWPKRARNCRIKTLARLSGLESREIRRGSAYLLHWYGVPKAHYRDSEQLPPSWEKLKQSAREAKSWLDRTYIVEGAANTDLREIEKYIGELRAAGK